MTPSEVETLFRDGTVHGQVSSGEQVQAFRVAELQRVLDLVRYQWTTGSEDVDLIAEKLGDGSRDGKSALLMSKSLKWRLYSLEWHCACRF